MTEHTKGPWRLQDRCEDLVVMSADGEELAEVYQRNLREDEGMANARLMVAAPYLLAACLIALEDLGTWRDESHSNIYLGQDLQTSCHCTTCEVSIPRLKAAIAKATGGNDDEQD